MMRGCLLDDSAFPAMSSVRFPGKGSWFFAISHQKDTAVIFGFSFILRVRFRRVSFKTRINAIMLLLLILT